MREDNFSYRKEWDEVEEDEEEDEGTVRRRDGSNNALNSSSLRTRNRWRLGRICSSAIIFDETLLLPYTPVRYGSLMLRIFDDDDDDNDDNDDMHFDEALTAICLIRFNIDGDNMLLLNEVWMNRTETGQ